MGPRQRRAKLRHSSNGYARGRHGVQTRVIAPCLIRLRGASVVSCPSPSKGQCGTPGGSTAPGRHVLWDTWLRACGDARRCVALRFTRSRTSLHRLDQDSLGNRNTLRSAKRRFYQLATPSSVPAGRFDQVRASPHCWVLGPPTHACRYVPSILAGTPPAKGRHARRVRRIRPAP